MPAAAASPATALSWKEDGNAHLKSGDKEAALQSYTEGIVSARKELIALDGEEAMLSQSVLLSQLCSNRAQVLLILGRLPEAIKDCRQAVDFDPLNCKAYWRGTTAALKLEKNGAAADFLRRGLRDAQDANGSAALTDLLGKSVEVWETVAARGIAPGEYLLALCYLRGYGVEIDLAKAKEFLKKAADQGVEEASSLLKLMLEESKPVSDIEKSSRNRMFEDWARAAAKGDADAQFNLGLAYMKGEGVEKNQQKGIELWKKAAEQGDQMALSNLEALMKEHQNASKK